MQRTVPPAGYNSDFALWAQSQAAALRERRFHDLDLSNLIEEIDDLSKRDRDAIRSRMTTIALHLLKLHHQPERASRSWLGTIVSRSTRIRRLIDGSPSLRHELLDYAPPMPMRDRRRVPRRASRSRPSPNRRRPSLSPPCERHWPAKTSAARLVQAKRKRR